jgi:hypothetical protein
VSLSAISFPLIPACSGTQYSPTACWVEFNTRTEVFICLRVTMCCIIP